jgi:hypothetical protein
VIRAIPLAGPSFFSLNKKNAHVMIIFFKKQGKSNTRA